LKNKKKEIEKIKEQQQQMQLLLDKMNELEKK